MEQLSGATIGRLLAEARDGDGPWGRSRSPSRRHVLAEPLPAAPPESEALVPALAALLASQSQTIGVERRLVRRAEAVWQSLRRGDLTPPPEAVAELLRPPFAGNSAMVAFPPHPADPASPMARIAFVGEALASLDLLVLGTAARDPRPDAPLGARLVALAERAVDLRAPVQMDSESDAPRQRRRPAAAGRAELLMRAIALPMAPSPGVGPAAVVVTSWRQLLSADETAALHCELAAAIDWMAGGRARPAG